MDTGVKRAAFLRIPQAIWKGYTYLYYRIYAANLRVAGESDLPQWNAMFGVAALSGLNLMTFIVSMMWISGIDPFRDGVPRNLVIACAVVWMYINYRLLVRNEKYKAIAKGFSNETRTRRRLNAAFCWFYVVMTFVVMGVAARFA